jgi:hypothetical protein
MSQREYGAMYDRGQANVSYWESGEDRPPDTVLEDVMNYAIFREVRKFSAELNKLRKANNEKRT